MPRHGLKRTSLNSRAAPRSGWRRYQRATCANGRAQIVAYTYYNGTLNGNKIDPDFFKDFILDQDNNINLPLFGVKGHEVLAGKHIDSTSVPFGISAFREALQKYWPAR